MASKLDWALASVAPLGFFHKLNSDLLYSGETLRLMESYQNDITGSFGYYFVAKIMNSPVHPAAAAFLFCSGSEVMQLFNPNVLGYQFKGTFDPYDFLAFGVGAAAAYCLEKLVEKNSSKQSVSGQPSYESS